MEMMDVGVKAIPIVSILAGTIGVMLAIQGIHTLKLFGAESRVTIGIALSVTREFAPLITGILVAGRSGSALAARLGTMNINQEIDALRVMGINPVRFLVSPALLAMLVMVPLLTFWAVLVGLFGAGLYVSLDLGMSMQAYAQRVIEVLSVDEFRAWPKQERDIRRLNHPCRGGQWRGCYGWRGGSGASDYALGGTSDQCDCRDRHDICVRGYALTWPPFKTKLRATCCPQSLRSLTW